MEADKQSFSEHVDELRTRLTVVALAIVAGSCVGYAIRDQLLSILRHPINSQKLYYTSPFGGFNVIIKISILFGLVLATPVILYQLGQFLKPAFQGHKTIGSWKSMFFSIVLAACGVSIAYFVSLPVALHFLTNIDPKNLHPFLIINDYLNFALGYLVAFALLFQLPLVILTIDYIKPQPPKKLMSYQRYAIFGSLILAVALNPAPSPLNIAIMALPIIFLYQLSIFLVYRRHKAVIKIIKATAAKNTRSEPAAQPKPRPKPIIDITPPKK